MAIFTLIATALLSGTFLAGSAIATSLVAGAIGIAASVGLSYAAQALAGKPQTPDVPVESFSVQTTVQMGGNVPRSFNIGYSVTAGSRVYINTWGNDGDTPNAYVTDVLALNDIPGGTIVEAWVNGELCTLGDTAHPDFGFPVTQYNKDGADHLWIKYYDGTQTTADNFLVTKVSSTAIPYEPTRVGVGVSYVICTSLINDTLFTGVPTFRFAHSGIPLYDPTKDSTNNGTGSHRWSDPATWGGDGDNLPAVQAYNILRGIYYGGAWLYGLQGMTAARLPTINWNQQIDKCRATITGANGLEPTYRTGGQINVNATIGNTLEAILTGCQGKISEIGGYYKIHLGTPDASAGDLTDDLIVVTEGQNFAPFFGLADSVNGITASYPDPAQAWNTAVAPPLYDTGFEKRDGDRRLLANPSFDFVPYAEQVQRLQKSALQEARRERRHVLVLPPQYCILEPGDIISWTSVRNGYDAKLFRVDGIVDKANLDVLVNITEVDPTDYDWNHGEFRPVTAGPTTFPRPEPQGIVEWFAEGAIIKDTDGIDRRPGIRMTWDGDMPGVIGVQYEVRLASDPSDDPVRGRTDQLAAGALLISQSLLPEMAYEVRGQYLPSAPRDMLWSDWLPVTTPDVKFSVLDFQDGLKDLVTNYFGQTTDQINSVLQTISAVVAQQAGSNQNNNKQVIDRLVATAGRLGASIEQTRTVAVGVDSALAEYKLATTALIDEHSASIEQTQTAVATIDEKLATSWAIKANVDNYITSIELLNDGTTSAFVIMADIFKIVFPGMTPKDVFQIANVDGVPQAVLRADLIADGGIKATQIDAGTITAISTHFGDAQIDGKLTMGPGGRLVLDGYIGAIMGFRVP